MGSLCSLHKMTQTVTRMPSKKTQMVWVLAKWVINNQSKVLSLNNRRLQPFNFNKRKRIPSKIAALKYWEVFTVLLITHKMVERCPFRGNKHKTSVKFLRLLFSKLKEYLRAQVKSQPRISKVRRIFCMSSPERKIW